MKSKNKNGKILRFDEWTLYRKEITNFGDTICSLLLCFVNIARMESFSLIQTSHLAMFKKGKRKTTEIGQRITFLSAEQVKIASSWEWKNNGRWNVINLTSCHGISQLNWARILRKYDVIWPSPICELSTSLSCNLETLFP